MFNNERSHTIHGSGDQVRTRLEYQGEVSASHTPTIADGPKFRLKHKNMLAAALAIVIVISAARLVRDSVLYERTNDAQIDGHITPVSARINGQVQQVHVIEGQLVHAGDVLADMDQRECSIAVIQAMANVAYAQSTAASLYFNAGITVTSAYGGLNSAQAAVKNAEIEVVTRVRIDFDRPESPDFNAAGLLKPGLSVKPEVRVRWLPRTPSPPERLPGDRL
ncbi:MAG TPA: biotin/lipoyl-binding protein [Bryobacteraceae bacterium]|nr:biotin/lipoyl-binding protein [Bryobacteraceae bacterium]